MLLTTFKFSFFFNSYLIFYSFILSFTSGDELFILHKTLVLISTQYTFYLKCICQ
jgi:hypothetical protein